MTHTLPELPYAYDALEPHLDARTLEIHHSKHHQTYVDNLNKALGGQTDLLEKPLEDLLKDLQQLPEEVRTAVKNAGGGHYNHSFFWTTLSPNSVSGPSGKLVEAMNSTFGGFEAFQVEFTKSALACFGSGWTWLVLSKGELSIISRPNQDTPISEGLIPLLCVDLWEHAYYLKFQNRRAEYITAWWNVVNWKQVEKYYEENQG